jgi:hypothetical protein
MGERPVSISYSTPSTFALKRFDISPEIPIVQELFSIKTLKILCNIYYSGNFTFYYGTKIYRSLEMTLHLEKFEEPTLEFRRLGKYILASSLPLYFLGM